jgi:hypothetical protein
LLFNSAINSTQGGKSGCHFQKGENLLQGPHWIIFNSLFNT